MALSRAKGLNITKNDTRRMEEEAKQMEAKLELLRRTMEVAEQSGKSADGRWRSGANNKPLTKGYVKSVLEAPNKKGKSGTPKSGTLAEATEASPLAPLPSPSPSNSNASPLAPLVTSNSPSTVGATSAARNLQAAMQSQDRDALEVEAFLCSLKLDRYVVLFMEHGFDCMDVVKEMEEEHMQQIGMATGHILKLRKRLAEFKPKKASEGAEKDLTRKVSFSEAPKPKETEAAGFSKSLLEGAFDEEDSAASFQEALKAWRGGAAEAPGSFWSSLGGSDVNLERASTPSKLPAESTAAETSNVALGEEKLCCYQCFKQFYAQFAVEREDETAGGQRRLCSEACADAWCAAARAKAEAFEKRQLQLQQMQEMQRAMAEEEAPAA
ncbi:unnamed protein product [Effrenium voratum]|uniref:SAM domain-containing protein n=1 Tax=Effrenium voratum TaxID=2562239 RepID=A0AA36IED5_9DINO|nr:unnamed protein product [Effrenium voratum]